ncbi:hypothetical protein H2200_003639 [Cladophialophora chaetospira]|uniref:Xylanolytic transcriptional activator regulatory domain-containing protein n=1 Tax=Cladophialophora chaetospira TaxID=386627 RepID=A0AA38XEN2_9EURO|nr:hypothetical protein H2200_003639 [Cladophialophora chaetospira]
MDATGSKTAERPNKRRRVPDELRKRSVQSCDLCRQTRFYGSWDDLSSRYRCLDALVKHTYPNDVTDTVTDLLQLGRRLGFEMPDLDAENSISRKDLLKSEASVGGVSSCNLQNEAPHILPSITTTSPETQMNQDHQRPSAAQRRVSGGFVRDASGQAHFIGPSGTLSFFADLRHLVRSRAGNPGLGDTDESSRFAHDDTTRALEADDLQDSNEPDSSEDLVGPSPQSILSDLSREFSGPARPDPEEFLECLPPSEIIEELAQEYFAKIHPDFPIFSRALFEDELDLFVIQPRIRKYHGTLHQHEVTGGEKASPDFGWLACLRMILLLGSVGPSVRKMAIDLGRLRRQCLAEVRSFIPHLVTKCTITSVQALLLQAFFLHSNNHRNGAWTLLGTATRISFALGLHRSDPEIALRPIERELRKRIFCTLYGFEQFLSSSLGRPSGLNEFDVDVKAPRDGFLDDVTGQTSQYTIAGSSLQMILGQTRIAIARLKDNLDGDIATSNSATPSPDVEILHKLQQWKRTLPAHLNIPTIVDLNGTSLPSVHGSDTSSPETLSARDLKLSLSRQTATQMRALILLHIQYHYVAVLVTRPTLLWQISSMRSRSTSRRASQAAGSYHDARKNDSRGETRAKIAETCEFHAAQLAALTVFLHENQLLNGVSALDVFYAYSAGLVLILGFLKDVDLSRHSHGSELSHQEVLDDGTRVEIRNDTFDRRALIQALRSTLETVEKCATMRRMAGVMERFAKSVMKDDILRKPAHRPEVAHHAISAQHSGIAQRSPGSGSRGKNDANLNQASHSTGSVLPILNGTVSENSAQLIAEYNSRPTPETSQWPLSPDSAPARTEQHFRPTENSRSWVSRTEDNIQKNQSGGTLAHHSLSSMENQPHSTRQYQPHQNLRSLDNIPGNSLQREYWLNAVGQAGDVLVDPYGSAAAMQSDRPYSLGNQAHTQDAGDASRASFWYDPLATLADGQIVDWADLESFLAS